MIVSTGRRAALQTNTSFLPAGNEGNLKTLYSSQIHEFDIPRKTNAFTHCIRIMYCTYNSIFA